MRFATKYVVIVLAFAALLIVGIKELIEVRGGPEPAMAADEIVARRVCRLGKGHPPNSHPAPVCRPGRLRHSTVPELTEG